MPLIFAFPRSQNQKPPRYTAAWRAVLGLWQIEEDGRALGIFCASEVEALAVTHALNFKRDILRHSAPVFLPTPGTYYVN
jgi:hypothetical protein